MSTKGLETWSSEDGKTSTGIWECGPGPSRWEMQGEGELIHVVRGRMTCTAEDGTVTEIGPGDSYTFEPGWTGRWDIHETLRKVYAIFPRLTPRTLRVVTTVRRSEQLPEGLRETVQARLRRANQRLTPNREALLEVLARSGKDVPASASIEQSVRDVARQIARRTGFKTQRHRIDLFGLCERCA